MKNSEQKDECLTSCGNIANAMLAEALVHPILFSTPMVQAIMKGQKTQTRRIVKGMALDWLQPNMFTPEFIANTENNMCPYGKVGSLLWVRETWKPKRFAGFQLDGFDYKADHVTWLQKNGQEFSKGSGCETGEVWKPSIFMPKNACRLFLKITDLKIERLQDISIDDCIAEGSPMIQSENYHYDWYRNLWIKINGQKSWDENPFVWVISFQKCERPKGFC